MEAKPDNRKSTRRGRQGTVRRCAVTRQEASVDRLLRFVADPDGAIVPDVLCRLPGRGVWVSATRPAVEEAAKKNVFARSLRRKVDVEHDLADRVDRRLSQQAMNLLSIANKCGEVLSGFAKVEAGIKSGAVFLLAHATHASEDGKRKLDRLLRACTSDEGKIVELFASTELSLALGRSNVIHAGLIRGGASVKFLNEAARLARYRLLADPNFGPAAVRDNTEQV